MDNSGTASKTMAMTAANFLTVSVTCEGFSLPLRDSGQVKCTEENDATPGTWQLNSSCTTATAGWTMPAGQDAAMLNNRARSFTGPVEHATYTSDFTTVDNVTGLIWKTCTEGFFGSTCGSGSAIGKSWIDAGLACRNLNDANSGAGYAGRKDWRLPTHQELYSILNFANFAPSTDAAYFPGSDNSPRWTSSIWGGNPSTAKTVVIYNASSEWSTAKTTNTVLVRCVAGAGNGKAQSFTDNGNETISDNNTGLVWQKCSAGLSGADCSTGTAGTYNWKDSLAYCSSLTLGGKSWRLPDIYELYSVVYAGKTGGVAQINPVFPGTLTAGFYNTSTTISSPSAPFRNAGIAFNEGIDGAPLKTTGTGPVRCVRAH